jgi:hypothetical protein
MNDREFSDIEIFERSRKGNMAVYANIMLLILMLVMYEIKKKLESYLRVNLLGPGPSSYKQNYLPGRGLTKVGKHWTTPLLTCLFTNLLIP